jgi:2-methylcitrate dehydratase PrpD
MSLSRVFVDHLREFSASPLPDALRQAKDCFADYLGVALAGSFEERERTNRYLDACGRESGSVPVLGTGRRAGGLEAAFLNGFNAHVCELDDGHRFGMMHPGAPVFSALVSAVSTRPVPCGAFYRGAAAGYEAAARLSRLMQPAHKLRGYHATGTCGAVGAAMAVAVPLGFDGGQMMGALAAAATGGAGLLEVIDDGSELKPYNAGRAAMDGLNAALVGSQGYCPPVDVLGGKRGFFKVLADVSVGEEAFARALEAGGPEILNIYRKPYAACRHCHPAIEAALALRGEAGDIAAIDRVDVHTYKLAVAGHDHTAVQGPGSAKMSTPYGVAAALRFGFSDLRSFGEEALKDPGIAALLPRVAVAEDASMTAQCPGVRTARVVLHLKDGRALEKRVDFPKGEPENPMSEMELKEKMQSLFLHAGNENALSVWDAIHGDCGIEDILKMCE